MITDPLFYLLAIPAITALGLGKGGFAGVGAVVMLRRAGYDDVTVFVMHVPAVGPR